MSKLSAGSEFFQPSGIFSRQRRFEAWARELIRLPRPGEGPVDHLLPEAEWQRPLQQSPDPEGWLAALSQAMGIYFFPSREWPTRLFEAGAGRGYLSAALAPLSRAAGLS